MRAVQISDLGIRDPEVKATLILKRKVNDGFVARTLVDGDAPNLSDVEIDVVGSDSLLATYAISDSAN